jgi:hypothetical protein
MSESQSKTEGKSEYLKDAPAAEFLNLSVYTMRNWRCKGEGPKFRRFGRAIRYKMADLVEYAERAAK